MPAREVTQYMLNKWIHALTQFKVFQCFPTHACTSKPLPLYTRSLVTYIFPTSPVPNHYALVLSLHSPPPPPNILHKQHHFYNWSTHLHITITYWRAELRGEGCRMKRKHSHNFLKPFLFIFRKPLPPFKGHLTSQTSRSVFQVSELIASVWSSSPSQLQPSHIVITLIVHVHPRMSPPFWFLFYGCN